MRSSINMEITIPIIFVVVHMAMVNTVFAEVEKELENMKTYLHTVTQQVMLQQFFAEQRTRSEGQSGIIAQRLRRGGTKNYFTESHSVYIPNVLQFTIMLIISVLLVWENLQQF